MNLYLLVQTENISNAYGSCVVCARSEESAVLISPDRLDPNDQTKPFNQHGTWASSPNHVTAIEIGTAKPSICRMSGEHLVIASYKEW